MFALQVTDDLLGQGLRGLAVGDRDVGVVVDVDGDLVGDLQNVLALTHHHPVRALFPVGAVPRPLIRTFPDGSNAQSAPPETTVNCAQRSPLLPPSAPTSSRCTHIIESANVLVT